MSKKRQKDDTQKDLQNHGVKDIIPENEEYYTINLNRAENSDVNDAPEMQIVGNDPLDSDADETIVTVDTTNTSSNSGGPVKNTDIVDEDNDNGAVAGEPGHWGIDEDTG